MPAWNPSGLTFRANSVTTNRWNIATLCTPFASTARRCVPSWRSARTKHCFAVRARYRFLVRGTSLGCIRCVRFGATFQVVVRVCVHPPPCSYWWEQCRRGQGTVARQQTDAPGRRCQHSPRDRHRAGRAVSKQTAGSGGRGTSASCSANVDLLRITRPDIRRFALNAWNSRYAWQNASRGTTHRQLAEHGLGPRDGRQQRRFRRGLWRVNGRKQRAFAGEIALIGGRYTHTFERARLLRARVPLRRAI